MNKVKDIRTDNPDNYTNPGGVVILENSPVGESQSNAMVERAIKDVQNHIRIIKMQLEENIGIKFLR